MTARFTRLSGCLLAAAALLSTPLASAASADGYAGISEFSWTLVDLNPGDGIAPSIKFDVAGGAAWSQRLTVFPWLIDARDTFGATQVSAAEGNAASALSETGNMASAHAPAENGIFMAYAMHVASFELTPYTRIEFSATAKVDTTNPGTQTGGYALLEGGLVNAESAEPVSNFKLLLDSKDGSATQAWNPALSSGAETTIGYFRRDTMAYVNLVPVPEPSTYAMLLAGLGLIGWRARRSRS